MLRYTVLSRFVGSSVPKWCKKKWPKWFQKWSKWFQMSAKWFQKLPKKKCLHKSAVLLNSPKSLYFSIRLLFKNICWQELSKIGQSGHTVWKQQLAAPKDGRLWMEGVCVNKPTDYRFFNRREREREKEDLVLFAILLNFCFSLKLAFTKYLKIKNEWMARYDFNSVLWIYLIQRFLHWLFFGRKNSAFVACVALESGMVKQV